MDFLKITKTADSLIKLITFNFGLLANLKILRKFIAPFLVLLNIFMFLNQLHASIKEENVLVAFLGIAHVIFFQNMFAKAVSVSYYEDDIIDLFKWMENFYSENSQPIIAKIKEKTLGKTIWILQLFLKTYIPFIAFAVLYAVIFYSVYGIQAVKIPYLSTRTNLWIQPVLFATYIPLYGVPVVCFGWIGITFMGILRYFNECIAVLENDLTQQYDDGLLIVLHKMHREIYTKFHIYENIIFYSVFFDITLNTGTSIFVLVIINLYPLYTPFHITFTLLMTQVLVYCTFGEFLFIETERIPDSLYLTKWYDFNKKDKRTLLLMMMMASRPFGLKLTGLDNLNLFLFVRIIKLIFSYCAIIYAFL